MAIWNISFFFFSPPEKPSLTERLANSLVISTTCFFSSMRRINSLPLRGSRPRYLRCSLTAVRIKLVMLTPAISTGYWKPRKSPSAALTSTGQSKMLRPLYRTSPWVTLYLGLPAMIPARVLLPLPLGPIMEWTSPSFTVRFTPFRISIPSILACKSFISSSDIICAL